MIFLFVPVDTTELPPFHQQSGNSPSPSPTLSASGHHHHHRLGNNSTNGHNLSALGTNATSVVVNTSSSSGNSNHGNTVHKALLHGILSGTTPTPGSLSHMHAHALITSHRTHSYTTSTSANTGKY